MDEDRLCRNGSHCEGKRMKAFGISEASSRRRARVEQLEEMLAMSEKNFIPAHQFLGSLLFF